jgi:flagella basal body P-ring formation protein FlgA
VLWGASAEAIEVRLKSECVPESRLVTMADIADISPAAGGTAERLAAVKLFPAPVRGKQRVARLGEIMELLTLRGFEVREIRFAGSDVVSIEAPQIARPAPPSPAQHRLPSSEIGRAGDEVKQAVSRFLAEQAGDDPPWAVELSLSPQTAEQILTGKGPLRVRSDAKLEAGRRTFQVGGRGLRPEDEIAIEAEIWQTPSIVVATRELARGERLTAADVKLQTADRRSVRTAAVANLEDAVGKELTRGVPEGQPIPPDAVRSPRLVQRGEIVTVYAHNAGVRVRIAARAREDGGQDDLVLVESLENRKTYYARVSGVQTVDVYAQARRARSSPPQPTLPAETGASEQTPVYSADRELQGGARG